MSKQIFIGIDPGTNGGLAAIDENMGVYALSRIPSSPEEIYRWFQFLNERDSYAVLEQVSGYIGAAHPGSIMFEFGRVYGHLEMALAVTGFSEGENFFRRTPQQWQKMLGLRKKEKGENDTSWKGYLKQEAQEYFPKIKVTLKTSDALLLAVVCRMMFLPEDK